MSQCDYVTTLRHGCDIVGARVKTTLFQAFLEVSKSEMFGSKVRRQTLHRSFIIPIIAKPHGRYGERHGEQNGEQNDGTAGGTAGGTASGTASETASGTACGTAIFEQLPS